MVGSARDIVEQAGVPRFLFVDFPLGNPMGKPDDIEGQAALTSLALDVLERSIVPLTTVQAPVVWGDDDWRANYMRVDDSNRAELAAAGAARREEQQVAKTDGRARTV